MDFLQKTISVPTFLRPKDATIELYEPRGKLFGYMLGSLVFVAIGVGISLAPHAGDADAWAGAAIVAVFGVGVLVFLLRFLAARRPVAILNAQGMARPSAYEGVLPWSAVQDCALVAYGRNRWFQVTLYPRAADHLRWKGLTGRLLALRGKASPARFSMPLACPPDEATRFIEAFMRHLNAAKAERPAGSERARIDAQKAREAERALEHEQFSEATATFPYATVGLIALLGIIFFLEIAASGGTSTPSIATLIRFGGLMGLLVAHGDWPRIFTAPFLHASLLHIVFNGVALWIVGQRFERYVGAAWFAAIFAGAAVAGSLMSLALNPPNLVSVGASGGIVGLFAATALASRHFPPGRIRALLLATAVQTLIPTLIPLASMPGGGRIDYANHFGGALGGLALGLALLTLWPQDLMRPRLQRAAAAGAASFALLGLGTMAYLVLRP